MSDSDSDFGDFAGADKSELTWSSSVESYLDVLLGVPQEIENKVEETHSLEELIKEERPRVIYEQLVLLDTHLRPFSWRTSHLRSLLLQTLQIEESHEEPIGVRALDDSLFLQIMSKLNLEPTTPEIKSVTAELGLLPVAEDVTIQPHDPTELTTVDFESLQPRDLKKYHDEMLEEIDKLYKELCGQLVLKRELEVDKATFEDVVTNLVGHTQRLRRDEIAAYNKKHGRSFKYGRKFRWVR